MTVSTEWLKEDPSSPSKELQRLREYGVNTRQDYNVLTSVVCAKVSEALETLMAGRGAASHEILQIRQRHETFNRVASLKKTFVEFDQKCNEYLEFEEFKDACISWGIDGTDEEIRATFARVDLDSNGKIGQEEFILGILEYKPSLWSLDTHLNELLEEILFTTEKLASDQDLIERLLIENSSSDALGTGAIKLKQQKDELNEENEKLLLEMSEMKSELRYMKERFLYLKDTVVTNIVDSFPEEHNDKYMKFEDFIVSESLEKCLEEVKGSLEIASDPEYIYYEEFCECWRVLGLRATDDDMEIMFGTENEMSRTDFFDVLRNKRYPEIVIQGCLNYVIDQLQQTQNRTSCDIDLTRTIENLIVNIENLQRLRGILTESDEELFVLYRTLRNVFDTSDLECSGRLRFSDFRKCIMLLQQDDLEENIENLFAVADVENIGSINWSQFLSIMMDKDTQNSLLQLLLSKLRLNIEDTCTYFEREKQLWLDYDTENIKHRYQNLLSRAENQEECIRQIYQSLEELETVSKEILGPWGKKLSSPISAVTSMLAETLHNSDGSEKISSTEFISLYQSLDPDIPEDVLNRMFAFLSKANEEYATITDLRSFLETKGESKTVYLRLHRIIKSLEDFQSQIKSRTRKRREKKRHKGYLLLRQLNEKKEQFYQKKKNVQIMIDEIEKLKRKLDICPEEEATEINRDIVSQLGKLKLTLGEQQILKDQIEFLQKYYNEAYT